MIIIDISGVAVAAAAIAFKLDGASGNADLDKSNIRHITLNSIREVNRKFRNKYGEMVIAFDNKDSKYWRKTIFPGYKAGRNKKKDDDDLPWDLMYEVLNELEDDLPNVFSYNTICVLTAEADDSIGVLTKYKSEDMSPEDVLIVSNDGDMKQLQKYPNVKQWSTRQNKFITESDPAFWLKEKKIRGDRKDGIPNIYSKVMHFVETPEIRQKSVTKIFLNEVLHKPMEPILSKQEFGRYKQNEILIDFEYIPNKLRETIINNYNEHNHFNNQSEVFKYLSKHGMHGLIDVIADFK